MFAESPWASFGVIQPCCHGGPPSAFTATALKARAAALDHFLNLFGLGIAREQCGKRPRLAFVAHKQTQAVGIATRIEKPGATLRGTQTFPRVSHRPRQALQPGAPKRCALARANRRNYRMDTHTFLARRTRTTRQWWTQENQAKRAVVVVVVANRDA